MRSAIRHLVLSVLLVLTGSASALAQPPGDSFPLDAHVVLNAFEGLVSERLDADLAILHTVAATKDAQSEDWRRIKPVLARFAEGEPANAAVWFARPNGSYFTVRDDFTKQNVSDRSYFPSLLAGKDVVATLVVSRSTGQKSVVVAAPVIRDGAVVGAVGVSIAVEQLSAFVDAKLALPPNIVFYALDAKGQTALHRDKALMFAYPSELGDDSLKNAVAEMLSKPEGAVSYVFRGARRTVIYRKSDATGWVFALGAVAQGAWR